MKKRKILNSEDGMSDGINCCWSIIYGLGCDCNKPTQRTKQEAKVDAIFWRNVNKELLHVQGVNDYIDLDKSKHK